MKMHQIGIGKWLASCLLASGVALSHPLAHAATVQQDATALVRGAQSWSQNCARCHNMRNATEFRDDQWKVIVNHMRVRAGLTGQEAREILLFLQNNN